MGVDFGDTEAPSPTRAADGVSWNFSFAGHLKRATRCDLKKPRDYVLINERLERTERARLIALIAGLFRLRSVGETHWQTLKQLRRALDGFCRVDLHMQLSCNKEA